MLSLLSVMVSNRLIEADVHAGNLLSHHLYDILHESVILTIVRQDIIDLLQILQ